MLISWPKKWVQRDEPIASKALYLGIRCFVTNRPKTDWLRTRAAISLSSVGCLGASPAGLAGAHPCGSDSRALWPSVPMGPLIPAFLTAWWAQGIIPREWKLKARAPLRPNLGSGPASLPWGSTSQSPCSSSPFKKSTLSRATTHLPEVLPRFCPECRCLPCSLCPACPSPRQRPSSFSPPGDAAQPSQPPRPQTCHRPRAQKVKPKPPSPSCLLSPRMAPLCPAPCLPLLCPCLYTLPSRLSF